MGMVDRLREIQFRREGEDTFKPNPSLLCHPQIPKPLHGLAPREILGKVWWDKERVAAKTRTGNRCAACGEYGFTSPTGYLEGHEIYQIDYLRGRATYVETVALCNWCHNFIHKGRMEALVDKGEMEPGLMQEILEHGYKLLEKANLRCPQPYTSVCADWEDWRLILHGNEYQPIYRSFEEWLEAYHKQE